MPTSVQQQQRHHHHTNPRSRVRVSLLKLGSSILPPSSTNLQINLVEPVLHFRGDAEESVGCFLRGDLIFNLTKPTKIRKIEMKFSGKMKTYWPEGKLQGSNNQNELCEVEKIISRSWTVVPPPSLPSGTSPPTPPTSSTPPSNSGSGSYRFSICSLSSSSSGFHLFPAGTYKYPFELLVPGNIPETIDAERGKVNYKLTATAVRPGLSSNIRASQHVPIVRTVLEERNSEGIAIASEWNDQLSYEITIPKKAYPIGDSVEIDLKLSPRAKNIKVTDVKIQINERSLYEAKRQKTVRSRTLSVYNVDDLTEQRITSSKNDLIDDDNLCEREDFGNSFYHKNILLPIPKCTSPIHFSCETSSIKISHHLKLIFKIGEGDKKRKKKTEVKVDVPITILSCRCEDDLPQYEDFEYCPCGEDGDPSSPRMEEGYGHHNSPSYEFPPSYEQSTDNEGDYLRRQSTQGI